MPARVAYLTNEYPAVSHTFIRREIRALEALGVEVDRYAVRGWDTDLADDDDRQERDATTYLLRDGLIGLAGDLWWVLRHRPRRLAGALVGAWRRSGNAIRPRPYHVAYFLQACRLVRKLSDTPVDHLHVHYATNPADVALTVRAMGGPTISITVHGSGELDFAPRLHMAEKAAASEFVVGISQFTRSQIMREVPVADWPRIKVVHCGLDAAGFADTVPPFPDAPSVVMVGRLSPEKGHLIALDAFREVLNDVPNARLTLAGDGPLRSEIETRIDDLSLKNSVAVTGWLSAEQVRERLIGATVLIQPSFVEGLPVVIMEAMAQGRPVIASQVAGVPELVQDGETGWLVPPGDASALAEAMRTALTQDVDHRARMADAAMLRVRARHRVTDAASQLVDLMGLSK